MGGFSIWHWLVVLVIVLLLFGTNRIPTLMSDVAKGIRNFRSGLKDGQAEGGEAEPRPGEARPADPRQIEPPSAQPAGPVAGTAGTATADRAAAQGTTAAARHD